MFMREKYQARYVTAAIPNLDKARPLPNDKGRGTALGD
jgi:hypothetical protein